MDRNYFKKQAEELVAKMTIEEKISQLVYTAPAIPRLGIPAYNWWNEALHGVARAGTATVFPQAIGMAASFNTGLMLQVASAISDEARANYNQYRKYGETQQYQGLNFWSPNINLFRDPRWGRGHETYGEDPYLTSRMAISFVKGLQGDGKYRKVDATLKHFAVHSGPEKIRAGFNAEPTPQDLRDTYLRAFHYVLKQADPSAFMGAYNRLLGEPCCGSPRLIEQTLRRKWGFEGYYVSDCGAICNMDSAHHVTSNRVESAALGLNSGCDLNCGSGYASLEAAYKEGLVSEETITKSCVRLFTARYALGMFADDCEYDRIPYDTVCSDENRAINREMAQESMVLLKNDGILPLSNRADLKIAVIGPNADAVNVLLGNYAGTMDRYTTLLRGIQEAAAGRVYYQKGCNISNPNPSPDDGENPRSAQMVAKLADVVILCMGLNPKIEGEDGDAGDKTTLEMPASQWDLYTKIKETGKPIVYVNVSGSALNLSDMKENCAAVLQCFYPGAEGGHALADLLFGAVSPSGRLPVTFYRSLDDVPPFADYSMEGRTYRYFKGEPVYPFGYGLTYNPVREEWLDEQTVLLTNEGKTEQKWTVLRYTERKGVRELCAFEKVLLAPGESRKVTVRDDEWAADTFDSAYFG
ncbi:MAG: glycoside hydrolase family 3 C-terminal domain-containing protein [Clostridia bacterium]|nr:glycoside hydrolase family 3 C-terminal domain-containing protein [Clostridia bacterium]